jgi:hypothetical protein
MMNVIRDTMNSTKMNNSVRRIRYLPIALAKASLFPPLKEIAPPDGPFRFEILPRPSGFLPFR